MAVHSDEAISRRGRGRSYQEYIDQQFQWSQRDKDPLIPGSRKLWKDMMIGFSVSVSFGLIILIVSLVFISDALESGYPFPILLCVLGMVSGLVIVVGTLILGKLSISQKWRHLKEPSSQQSQSYLQRGREISRHSQELPEPYIPTEEPPPPYSSIVRRLNEERGENTNASANATSGCNSLSTLVTPPNYSEVVAPVMDTSGNAAAGIYTLSYPVPTLPEYSEAAAPLPPYSSNT